MRALSGRAAVPAGPGCRALSDRAACCAGGRRPAREASAPRASLGAADLEVRPGPTAAHAHRSLSLYLVYARSLRCPPHLPHQSRMQFPRDYFGI